MLLNRDDDPFVVAKKVGMANFPAYILAQSIHSGSGYVGGSPPDVSSLSVQRTVAIMRDLETGSTKTEVTGSNRSVYPVAKI